MQRVTCMVIKNYYERSLNYAISKCFLLTVCYSSENRSLYNSVAQLLLGLATSWNVGLLHKAVRMAPFSQHN